MKTFKEIRSIHSNEFIEESISLFAKKEEVPHRITVSYHIQTNSGVKEHQKILPKIYPSEKHAYKDMKNMDMSHYASIRPTPYVKESLQEAEKKQEKKYNENNFAIIQNIVAKNKPDKLKFKDETDLDCGVKQANTILATHARLNGWNKKKLNGMIHQGKRHFIKIANFCQAHNK